MQKRKSTRTEEVWKEGGPPGSAPLEMSEIISDCRQTLAKVVQVGLNKQAVPKGRETIKGCNDVGESVRIPGQKLRMVNGARRGRVLLDIDIVSVRGRGSLTSIVCVVCLTV